MGTALVSDGFAGNKGQKETLIARIFETLLALITKSKDALSLSAHERFLPPPDDTEAHNEEK